MQRENLFWNPLKIDKSASNVFVWSDMHFGHKSENWDVPLWKKRGFISIEDHDEKLIKGWNESVGMNDDIFHLGDIMFGPDGDRRIDNLLNRLNFTNLYLMGGNHHSGFKQLFNKAEVVDGVFQVKNGHKTIFFLPNYFEVRFGGNSFVLSHYPILSWNGQGKGSIMVHGHCHDSLVNSHLGRNYIKSARCVEVTPECCPAPVSFGFLIDLFKNKDIVTFDHHNNETQNPF